jgi:hypothetical protein
MAVERRTQLVAGALAVVALVGAAYFLWWAPSAASAPASNGRGAEGAVARSTATIQAPDVHLPALGAERPKPVDSSRNLFRFKPKPTPPPPPAPKDATPPVPTGPPTPPPQAVINLRFIGVVEQSGRKIAMLSDSTGHPEAGGEGDIIQGRYRILKIGVESVEVAYLDGTGRRTIRLGS